MPRQKKVFRVPTYHPVFPDFQRVQTIQEIASSYDPQLLTAPFKAGHKSEPGSPAFAWFEEVKANGAFLEVTFDTRLLTEAGFKAIQSGNFRNLSPEFYHPDSPYNPLRVDEKPGKWYFKGLAYLGAESPAGKGIDVITATDIEGFKPPASWSAPATVPFQEGEEQGKTFVVFEETPPDLDGLKIAVPGIRWNQAEAAERVKQRYGWWGLGEYSLYRDYAKQYDDPTRYHALVVDIVLNEPMIVPAAVEAAARAIEEAPAASQWAEEDKNAALSRLNSLKVRIKKEQTIIGLSEPALNSGGQVKKLFELIQAAIKDLVPAGKLTEFTEKIVGEISPAVDVATFSGDDSAVNALVENLAKAQAAVFTEQGKSAQATADLEEARQQIASFTERERTGAIDAAFQRLQAKGKVPPRQKDRFVRFCRVLPSGENDVITFSEDGKQVSRTLLEELEALFAAIVPDDAYKPDTSELESGSEAARFTEEAKAAAATVDRFKKTRTQE